MVSLGSVSNENDIEPDTSSIFWGNNWEASSSSAPKFLQRLVRMDLVNNVDPEAIEVDQTAINTVDQLFPTADSDTQLGSISETVSPLQQHDDLQSTFLLENASPLPYVTGSILQSALMSGNVSPLQQAPNELQLALLPEDTNPLPIQAIMPTPNKKRKYRKRHTPIVDDEIQRSTRQHQVLGFEHMELDEKSKPRKLIKEDTTEMKRQLALALE